MRKKIASVVSTMSSMNPFEFYSQVYGLDEVIVPISATSAPKIVFVSSLSGTEFKKYSEMFSKITMAMGLKESDFVLQLQSHQSQVSPAQICVSFGGAPVGWKDAEKKNLTVPSFEEMAQQPELKKTAWNLLKQIEI